MKNLVIYIEELKMNIVFDWDLYRINERKNTINKIKKYYKLNTTAELINKLEELSSNNIIKEEDGK